MSSLVYSSPDGASIPTEHDAPPVSNARLIAELQALTIGIHLVGLDRLPEVMGASDRPTAGGYDDGEAGGVNP